MKLLSSLFLLMLSKYAVAQADLSSAHQIDSVAAAIDTIKDLRTAIADGAIRPKGKKKPTGGFSDTYYMTPRTNQLVKVDHGESYINNNFSSYYFYNDNLILETSAFHDNDSTVRNNRYYFYNGVLFFKQEQGQPLKKPEAMLSHAATYLEDAKYFKQ